MGYVYGGSFPSYSVVKECAKRFCIGQESHEDDTRNGRPVEVIMIKNVFLAEELVLSDLHVKVKEISDMSKLSYTSVHRILYDHLGMKKISNNFRLFSTSVVLNMGDLFYRCVDQTKRYHCNYDPIPYQESLKLRREEKAAPRKFRVCQSTKS